MGEKLYKIVFRGEIAPGQNIDEVKQKLAALYKGDISKIERKFFSGKPVVIKSKLDHQSALKRQSSLTARTGALFEVVEAVSSESQVKKPDSQPTPQPEPSPELEPQEEHSEQPTEESEPQTTEQEEVRAESYSDSETIVEQETAPPDTQSGTAPIWGEEEEEVSPFRKIIDYMIGAIIGILIILLIYHFVLSP